MPDRSFFSCKRFLSFLYLLISAYVFNQKQILEIIPKTYAIKINNPIDDKTIFLFFEAIVSLIDKITMSHIGKKTKNAPIASTHNVFTQSPISPNSLTVNTSITNINNKILCIVFIIPSFFNKKNTLKNVVFSRVFCGFNQQNGVFASTKQKAQNGRNNSWTQD